MDKTKKKFISGSRCLIVAEISANHNQSFLQARRLIDEAKRCSADAVKFQAYTPDSMTINANNKYFQIRHHEWGGQTLYQLYKKAYTPWRWLKRLKKISEDAGLLFFATAFEKTSVDFLEELGVTVHKISSFELVDLPLIEYAAKTGKPLIISTGMANIGEIKAAVQTAQGAGAKDIILLKCVTDYPALPEEMNLNSIAYLKRKFKLCVGLSDHSLGTAVSVAGVCLGACLVEKHFTISRKIKTPDSFFSLEPQEFKSLVNDIRIVEAALGSARLKLTERENKYKVFRRSLFAVKDIRRGEVFTEDNIRSIRPAYGMPPKYIHNILGKKSNTALKAGTPVKPSYISRIN